MGKLMPFVCVVALLLPVCAACKSGRGSSSSSQTASNPSSLYSWVGHAEKYSVFKNQASMGRSDGYTGLAISEDWAVRLDGVDYPVLATPISTDGPQSFVNLPYHKGAKIEVRALKDTINTYSVSPLSMKIPSSQAGNSITLTPERPAHICVLINGSEKTPLFISCFPEIPKPAGDNVKVFSKGLHQISYLDLRSDETIYLETGAVLQALPPDAGELPTIASDWTGRKNYRPFISGQFRKNVKIIGNGIIDTSKLDWHARSPLSLTGCDTVTLQGVTFIGAGSWTVILDRCSNVTVDNVRLFGFRENSDGIDIVNSSNINVSNCLARTGDDAICVKATANPPTPGGKNILVEACTVWNDKVRCLSVAGETKTDISDVTFRDCDIIRSEADWTKELGSCCVIVGDNGTVSNVLFDNIRIEQESEAILNCMILKDQFSSTMQPGKIRNITFRNISAPSGGVLRFLGYDADHRISGITVENLTIGGQKITSADQAGNSLDTNAFADPVVFK